MTAAEIKKELFSISGREQAANLLRFFKTGKGEYGEGDLFIGCYVPQLRKTAGKYSSIDLDELARLITDPYHECRMTALFILIEKFSSDISNQEKYINFYLNNIEYVNNWDLVDLSAPQLLGFWLYERDRSLLYKLAGSGDLWKERISILSTFYFIKNNDFTETLKLAEMFLGHSHDLIHKAAGWMLREIGKRDISVEKKFLNAYYKDMPRTMLRYAIERFDEKTRLEYLKGYI